MALNYIWIGFFLIAFLVGLGKLLFLGDMDVFPAMVGSTFDMAKTGFDIALGLTGVLTLWLGLLKVGEKGGIVHLLSRVIGPFFARLFPGLPRDHPATGPIMMNIAANMLGLDNAATPIGLKAMEQMQRDNPDKDTASDAQIMFLVLNTSGLTLIPISIMTYRALSGAADPTDIFLPILLATYFSTLAGLIAVAAYQRINLLNRTILLYLGVLTAVIGLLFFSLSRLDKDAIQQVSSVASNVILFSIITGFILLATKNRVNVYEAFIEGAKDGFRIATTIIPYLVAILVAVGAFRASGALEAIILGIQYVLGAIGINADFVPALPTAFMKPLSGSGARGMMVELMNAEGADSFAARVACTIQGSTDTTFYVIAVYFGAVGIRRTRHAIPCGLIADFAGIVAAILMAYLFFYQLPA